MRFVVVGTSGSGKSTFAQALAQATASPYVELDELFWLPNWTQRDRADFQEKVASATAGERWIADGNYSATRDILWPRATHVVWLNFSRFTVFARIVKRTVTRAARRQVLWAGNKESFRKALFSRDSIVLWSLTTFGKNRTKYRRLRESRTFPHLVWHEFRSPKEAQLFLRALQGEA